MKLVLGSDLHGHLPDVPSCDVLVLAGDILPENDQELFIEKYLKPWLNWARVRNIVATGGNHDHKLFKRQSYYQSLDCRLRWSLLIDRSTIIDGLKFHGTPWCLPIGRWAWQAPEYILEKIYAMIPDDVDVLISHTPPYEILDKTDPDPLKGKPSEHAGSSALIRRMAKLDKLKLLVCGHIHEARGRDGIVINASSLNRQYQLRPNPWVELEL